MENEFEGMVLVFDLINGVGIIKFNYGRVVVGTGTCGKSRLDLTGAFEVAGKVVFFSQEKEP